MQTFMRTIALLSFPALLLAQDTTGHSGAPLFGESVPPPILMQDAKPSNVVCVPQGTAAIILGAWRVDIYEFRKDAPCLPADLPWIRGRRMVQDGQLVDPLFRAGGWGQGYFATRKQTNTDANKDDSLRRLLSKEESYECQYSSLCIASPEFGIRFVASGDTVQALVSENCRIADLYDARGKPVGGGVLDRMAATILHNILGAPSFR